MSFLSQLPLFSALTEEESKLMEQHSTPRTFAKNTIIVNEGDQTDSLYVLVSGRLKVYCCDENGKEVTLNDLKEGDYFGEIALFDGETRSASVVTMSHCKCLIITRTAFKTAFSQHPELAFKIISQLTRRVRELTKNVKKLALMDVYGRVTNTLVQLASQENGHLITAIPLTQQEIANRVGASREMVARIMKDLETGGYIRQEKKKIIIENALPSQY